jgi:hypothetical protein
MTPGEPRRATVFADYGQFYVQDAAAHDAEMRAGAAMDPDRPVAGWTDEAVYVHRIGVEPHSISVGTARTDVVETTLHVGTGPPPLRTEAEHVVEADIYIPNGAISVVGCTDIPGPEHRAPVSAGRHRLRVSYVPCDPLEKYNPDEPGDHFQYRIDLWPTETPAPLAVLKQGPNTWAG